MATILIRYSNRANFVIKDSRVDLSTDEVKIVDYLQITSDKLYYHDYKYRNEVIAKGIKQSDFRQALFGTNFYRINDEQLKELMCTGQGWASGEYNTSKNRVYVGKFFEPVAKEVGDASLAKCYAEIEKVRAEYRKKCDIQNALLAIGTGTTIEPVEYNTDPLAADIETFLKNRAKCLAALKPKRKRVK